VLVGPLTDRLASSSLTADLCVACLDANCWVGGNLIKHISLSLSFSLPRRLSLLVVYYAQVLGKSTSNVPFRLCLFGNTIFLGICITLSVTSEASVMEDFARDVMRNVFVAVASFFSFLIASLLGYFGQKFSEYYQAESVNRSLLPHSVQKFHLMNLILVSTFTLRGILIILSATPYGNFPSDTEVVETDSDSHVSHLEIAYFFITEIIPCSFVLLTLWQPLCPKDPQKKSIDGANLCNHSEMNAKYNDMFSPRGSQISRDGDDTVRVVYSTFLGGESQKPLGDDDLESPSLSLSLSPYSPTQRKMNSIFTPEINPLNSGPPVIRTDLEALADLSSSSPTLPPRLPGPIGKRPLIIPPHIFNQPSTSTDDIGEERPSDANDLQYYHSNLSLDQIQDFSRSTSNPSTDSHFPSSAHQSVERGSGKFSYPFPPNTSINSMTSGGNSTPSTVPSLSNWLVGSEGIGTPPLHRPPSAPATTATTAASNSYPTPVQNSRISFGPSSSSPRPHFIASSEEKEQLMKQFAKALSPKYILQRY
jgi:hypothetical protein